MIAFFSRTSLEHNYCVTRKELLAVVLAVQHFRPYLYPTLPLPIPTFTIRTDHASLMWSCRQKEPSCQVAWWLELFAEFLFTVAHHDSRKPGNADSLNRQHHLLFRQCESIEQWDWDLRVVKWWDRLPRWKPMRSKLRRPDWLASEVMIPETSGSLPPPPPWHLSEPRPCTGSQQLSWWWPIRDRLRHSPHKIMEVMPPSPTDCGYRSPAHKPCGNPWFGRPTSRYIRVRRAH